MNGGCFALAYGSKRQKEYTVDYKRERNDEFVSNGSGEERKERERDVARGFFFVSYLCMRVVMNKYILVSLPLSPFVSLSRYIVIIVSFYALKANWQSSLPPQWHLTLSLPRPANTRATEAQSARDAIAVNKNSLRPCNPMHTVLPPSMIHGCPSPPIIIIIIILRIIR